MFWKKVVAVFVLGCLLRPATGSYASPIATVEPAVFTEQIPVDEPVTRRIISCEVYSEPVFHPESNRPVYGQRIVESFTPGTTIYWRSWAGVYDEIKDYVIHVAELLLEMPIISYLYSIFKVGFNPHPTSHVGIEVGYSYNTYIREAQILTSPSGDWVTYYTARTYHYFRHDRVTVQNPSGWNPPVYQYNYPMPGDVVEPRIAPSPNWDNYGVLSERAMLLYQNYCPAGWEDENYTYFPLDWGFAGE